MLVSVNIGVLLSEKLLPTLGLGLVFTERSGSKEEEGHTQKEYTHTHIETSHKCIHTDTHTCRRVDKCR